MLFTGHSELTIDAKLRLAIPAKYRNQWDAQRDGAAWVCVPWATGKHLRLYTEKAFEDLSDRREASLTPDADMADLESHLYGLAERLEMDSAGRITLPKLHTELTGLPSEVVIVGARNRLEVRERASWLASLQERFHSLPELVARVQTRRDGPRP